LQGCFLYGVRFGRTTKYVLIDIDRGSRYHPAADPQALRRIQDALELLGLPSCLMLTSSYSGGLHLYFPFDEAQVSWEIALGVTTLLGVNHRFGHSG
jgi:DNA primase